MEVEMKRPVHFEILAQDPQAVGAFYEKVLDWELSKWGESDYWLINTGEDGQPGINGALMGQQFAQAVINTIEVSSLDDVLQKVEEAGGKLVHGPTEVPGVGTHAYCADPEGILFGLMEPK